jgi:hypothetical protein
MIRRHTFLVISLSLIWTPALAAQGKSELIPLTKAVELMDKKVAEAQAELDDRVGKLVQATTDEEKSAAARALAEQQKLIQESQIKAQKLRSIVPAKGPPAHKTMLGWLDVVQKATTKLPPPPGPSPALPDFSLADKRAQDTTESDAESIKSLTRYLIQGMKTDREKARAIFTWIIENISYDYDGFKQKQEVTKPDQVLLKRRTICAGYAYLFESMSKQAGLQVGTINGFARVQLDHPLIGDVRTIRTQNGLAWGPHGWNSIKLDGKVYLVDPTWASRRQFINGKSEKNHEHNLDYFLIPPEALVYTHSPDDPKYQMLKNPLKRQEIETLPLLRPAFFRYDLKVGSAPQPTLGARDMVFVTLETPADVALTAYTRKMTSRDGRHDALVQRRDGVVEILAPTPGNGAYELLVFARKKDEDQEKGEWVMSYRVDAKGDNNAVALPQVYADFLGKAYLHYPLTASVAAGKMQSFAISVPDATKVVIRNNGKQSPLAKQGDMFVGSVALEAGEVLVAATFPDDTQQRYLLKYTAK